MSVDKPVRPASDPYTIWKLVAPFNKHGVPVMGASGRSIDEVVVMRTETMQRILREHPSLATAQFRLGTYEETTE